MFQVFKTSGPKADKAKEVAESILSYFPGFDAFKLPPPSSDPDVVLNLNRDEVQDDVNKSFIRGVDEFKSVMRSKLTPKHSFNEAEFVTGEGTVLRKILGFALLIHNYDPLESTDRLTNWLTKTSRCSSLICPRVSL